MADAAVAEPPAAPAAAQPAAAPKAKNGYYYWHGHEKERKELGDVAPMPTHVALASETVAEAPREVVSELHKYSWCNNTKTVSVYVDVDGVDESNVAVDFQADTLTVRVRQSELAVRQLKLPLSKEINPEKCSFRLKPNQVVVKLAKGNEEDTWFDLVAKA
eukprot:CAMPEP_0174828422 /NCGR_PEP_ID=MMETSP1114-20130205/1318_1 /TAXON_ID=312471 /ORGANISM="Neobodo designis, Strain CCAP 1951/1" /LENGTH=160 /DNA_ID=CAMNT_0016062135 /DNA_START=32 /DNA_END=514 /DNA_ORIENTATION=-